MRVIIADDSVYIRDRLLSKLSSFKQVEIVGSYDNGTEALQALKTMKPDLAIVDIEMPGLSGLEVLTEIRKENTSLRFVILSFFCSDFYRHLAIETGADYCISKVDDFDRVDEVVNNMLKLEVNQLI